MPQQFLLVKDVAHATNTFAVSVVPFFRTSRYSKYPIHVLLGAPWRTPQLCKPEHLNVPDIGPDPKYVAENGTFAFGPFGGKMETGDTIVGRMRLELLQETAYVVEVDEEEMSRAKVLFRTRDNALSAEYNPEVKYSCVNAFLDLTDWLSRREDVCSALKLPGICAENAKRVYAEQSPNDDAASRKALEEKKHAIESQWWSMQPLAPLLEELSKGLVPTVKEVGERVRPSGFPRASEWLGNEYTYDGWAAGYGLVFMPLTAVSWSKHPELVSGVFELENQQALSEWYPEACLVLRSVCETITLMEEGRDVLFSHFPQWKRWRTIVFEFRDRLRAVDPKDVSIRFDADSFVSFHKPLFDTIVNRKNANNMEVTDALEDWLRAQKKVDPHGFRL